MKNKKESRLIKKQSLKSTCTQREMPNNPLQCIHPFSVIAFSIQFPCEWKMSQLLLDRRQAHPEQVTVWLTYILAVYLLSFFLFLSSCLVLFRVGGGAVPLVVML